MTAACRLLGAGLLLILGQLLACDLLDRPSEELAPIEGTVLFRVHERHEVSEGCREPVVFLTMETEKIYGCYNFTIEFELRHCGHTVWVNLLGVHKPSLCLTALGPARAASRLDLPTGVYRLRFTLADSADEYELAITDSSISIADSDSSFTRAQTCLTWRYPPESCAYLCGTTTETSWICSDFLDSLLNAVRFEEFQFPDSGAVPYPMLSMGHYYDMPAMYFRYAAEEDFDSAGAVLERYTRTVISQHSGVGLSLVNWKNKSYSSWLFED